MIIVTAYHPRAEEMCGFIPSFLREHDPRPAKEQFNERYLGGWNPFSGFEMQKDKSLKYPNDRPEYMVASIEFNNETIYIYNHAWVAIVQQDGTYEVARMD